MSKNRKKQPVRPAEDKNRDKTPVPCDPVDVVAGIPDRRAHCALWRYAILGLIFVGWLTFLVYCQVAATIK